jgi:hypothetical protein
MRAKRVDERNIGLRKRWANVMKMGRLGRIPIGNSKEN